MLIVWAHQQVAAAEQFPDPMLLAFTAPDNTLFPADITNAPDWFNPAMSFFLVVPGNEPDILMQFAVDHWILLQGTFPTAEGAAVLSQLGNTTQAVFSGATV